EADRPLDIWLLCWPSRGTRLYSEPPDLGGFEETGIENGGLPTSLLYDGLHVIEDVHQGPAAKKLKGLVHAAQKAAHGLAEREDDEEVARVRQGGDEGTDAAGAASDGVTEVGPVDLEHSPRPVVAF